MDKKGYSLIEMLIAVALFAIIAAVSTQSLATSIRGTRKGEAMTRVRENVDYAINMMERLLRNARTIDTCEATELIFTDLNDEEGTFECEGDFISYNGSRMTSTDVTIDCSSLFSCFEPGDGVFQSVTITLTGEDPDLGGGAEGAVVTSETRIILRTYQGW